VMMRRRKRSSQRQFQCQFQCQRQFNFRRKMRSNKYFRW